MDISRAKEILSTLAEGVDPTTGEILPDSCVCNKAEVVRALYAALGCLKAKDRKKYLPANSGKPWSEEDEALLIRLYRAGSSKKDICKALQRTETGIAARLVRLGITESRDIFRDRK